MTQDEIAFTPVPSKTNRRDGWTAERQRDYIFCLQSIGSVTAACRAVGKSVRSAYALRERPGADSFAQAWDMAIEMGVDELRDSVIDRIRHGAIVPVFRKGREVNKVHRFYDRLAIAVLGGRSRHLGEDRAAAACVSMAKVEPKPQPPQATPAVPRPPTVKPPRAVPRIRFL